jgi:beta-xylosidase
MLCFKKKITIFDPVMRKLTLILLAAATVAAGGCGRKETRTVNPLNIKLGDPFVLLASDGSYYMYGTTEGTNGFDCYRSDDLAAWDSLGRAFRAADDSWGVSCFWAPEVYERNGRFYMFYSANDRNNPDGELENFRIGVAASDSPTGPFTNISDRPLFDPGYPIIDANVLFDNDNRCYLYYSRCCYKNPIESETAVWAREQGLYDSIEESWIYGVELKPDFSGVIGQPTLLLRPPVTMGHASDDWESRSVTAGEAGRRWNEGSFILRDGDTYYMMFSANFYGGENYAVGYATSRSPLGPFEKSPDNPVLEKNSDRGGVVTGTGHNSITRSRDGRTLYCVYHGRTSATGPERVVFIDRMEIRDGALTVFGPTTGE